MTQTEPTLRRILQGRLISCAPSTPISAAAQRMVEARCSSILIEEDGHIIGIWTERDALALHGGDSASCSAPIATVMSSPVRTIDIDTRLGEAALRFRQEKIRHFVVVDAGGKQLGIVSQSDVVINQGVEYYISLREVKSVFTHRLLVVPASLDAQAAMREMHQGEFDALVVEATNGTQGILTERDVVRLIGGKGFSRSVGDVASFPLISISASASLFQARKQFIEHDIRHLGVRDDDGKLLGLITYAEILANIELDYVRKLKETLRERDEILAVSNKQLRLAARAFESTFEGILVTNAEQVIESVNPAFTMITGYRAHEVIGRKPSMLSSGQHDRAFYDAMFQALSSEGHWQGEVWNRRRDGEIYVEWLTINAVKDEKGVLSNYVAVFSDITRRKAAEERLSFLAQHDALTSLPNRVLLDDRLSRAIAHARRNAKKLAVIFLDLDDFKQINDTIGHHAGDRVLQLVAQRLTSCVRKEDTVARLGGDEFVVVLEEIESDSDLPEIIHKFLAALTPPYLIDGHTLQVHCSIGVSLFPEAGSDPETLIQSADAAMYQAKEQGESSFHFATRNAS